MVYDGSELLGNAGVGSPGDEPLMRCHNYMEPLKDGILSVDKATT